MDDLLDDVQRRFYSFNNYVDDIVTAVPLYKQEDMDINLYDLNLEFIIEYETDFSVLFLDTNVTYDHNTELVSKT